MLRSLLKRRMFERLSRELEREVERVVERCTEILKGEKEIREMMERMHWFKATVLLVAKISVERKDYDSAIRLLEEKISLLREEPERFCY